MPDTDVQDPYENAKLMMERNLMVAMLSDGVKATYGNAPAVGLKAMIAIITAPTSNPAAVAYGGITRNSSAVTDYWKNQFKDMS